MSPPAGAGPEPGAVLRRASYGPASPAIGERGAHTRQQILRAMLELLGERGYHDVLVDEITGSVGISRATLYQYFESKEEIFVELLRDATDDLLRVSARLGRLGPSPEGYDNLHWWLGEWAWIYDKHGTVLDQWAQLQSVDEAFDAEARRLADVYEDRLAFRIVEAGVEGFEVDDLAVVLLSIVGRVNYYRHLGGGRGLGDDEILDTLATVLQLVLFPGTPPDALRPTTVGREPSDRGPAARPARQWDTDPGLPRVVRRAPRLARSARAAATVEKLRRAGAEEFAVQGYQRTTIDDIVLRAGLGRGTFYKYFDDKLEMLLGLADDCADALDALLDALQAMGRNASNLHDLRAWLSAVVDFRTTYIGVFRLWFDPVPIHPDLAWLGRAVERRTVHVFDDVLGRVRRPYPFSVKAASLVMVALIEQMPGTPTRGLSATEARPPVDLLAGIVQRGLLHGLVEVNRPSTPPKPHPVGRSGA